MCDIVLQEKMFLVTEVELLVLVKAFSVSTVISLCLGWILMMAFNHISGSGHIFHLLLGVQGAS